MPPTFAGNHEEEMELEFGDDYTQTTGCVYPGLVGAKGGDCARAFLCDPSPRTNPVPDSHAGT